MEAFELQPPRVVQPYPLELARAFLYPVRPMVFAVAMVVACVTGLVAHIPQVGRLLSWAMVLAYLATIARHTGLGRDDVDVAPEDLGREPLGWLRPYFVYGGAALVAFSPALLASVGLEGTQYGVVVDLLFVLGVAYLPAALATAVNTSGLLAPLNPLPALRLIAQIPKAYALTLVFLALAAAVQQMFGFAAEQLSLALGATPILPTLLSRALTLLPLVVMARMLGVMVREHTEELF